MKRELFVVLALAAGVACGAPGLTSAADKDMKSDKADKTDTYKTDNSKMNKEMRANKESTAEQQKENPADRKLAQQMRRAVVKDKSLSTYGHNVKIIVRDGNVTLKGPVRDEAEKAKIEKDVAAVAGAGKITNELTVAPKEKKAKEKKEEKKE